MMTSSDWTKTPIREFEENIQYAKALIAGGVALQNLDNFPAHPEELYLLRGTRQSPLWITGCTTSSLSVP